MIQSNMSNAFVRLLTCSLQYTLRHAYMAARPPIKLYGPKSNTAALPMYASELCVCNDHPIRFEHVYVKTSVIDPPKMAVAERLGNSVVLHLLWQAVRFEGVGLTGELGKLLPEVLALLGSDLRRLQ
jgi:hypothetical protein